MSDDEVTRVACFDIWGRVRLYWQLLRCAPALIRAVERSDATAVRQIRSLVESIHRDLGHDYDRNVILRQHE